jgi:hypothetical protein
VFSDRKPPQHVVEAGVVGGMDVFGVGDDGGPGWLIGSGDDDVVYGERDDGAARSPGS